MDEKNQAAPRIHQHQLQGAPGRERGKVGWLVLWLLGVPIPILLFLFLIRGCT